MIEIKRRTKMSHQTSKSFRATLPNASDDQLEQLQRWADANCSNSALFRDEGDVVWLASRERARSKSAFLKSTRALLKKFGFETGALTGRWLTLTTDDVVNSEAAISRKCAQSATRASEPGELRLCGTAGPTDGDVKVIVLNGVGRASSRASRHQITKEA